MRGEWEVLRARGKEGLWVEGRAQGRNVWRGREAEGRGVRKGRVGGVAARPGQGEAEGRSVLTQVHSFITTED